LTHISARLRRVATVATLSTALIGLATTAAAPASATSKTVTGCFGVVVVYCDPTVEYVLPFTVGTTTTTVPVCAGTCTDVPVPVPTVSLVGGAHVCVTANDRNGSQNLNTCLPLAAPRLASCYYGDTGYRVVDANDNEILNACYYTGDVPRPGYRVCHSYDGTPGVTLWDRNSGTEYLTTCN
jgi:hypothetical protein